MLDPLEHTWSRSDLMCREGRALKIPRCCRGHSTVFDSTDDIDKVVQTPFITWIVRLKVVVKFYQSSVVNFFMTFSDISNR